MECTGAVLRECTEERCLQKVAPLGCTSHVCWALLAKRTYPMGRIQPARTALWKPFPKSSEKLNDVQGCCSSRASRQVMAVQGWRGRCRSGSKPLALMGFLLLTAVYLRSGLLYHTSKTLPQLAAYVKITKLGQGKGILLLSVAWEKLLGVWEAVNTSLLAQVCGDGGPETSHSWVGVEFSSPEAAATATVSYLIHGHFFNEFV